MKIIVNYTKEGTILDVHTFSYFNEKGKTDEEITKAVEQSNEQMKFDKFHVVEIPENLEEVFKFMLGDNPYKQTCTLSHIYDKLNDIQGNLDSMQRDLYDASEWIGETTREIKKVIEEN